MNPVLNYFDFSVTRLYDQFSLIDGYSLVQRNGEDLAKQFDDLKTKVLASKCEKVIISDGCIFS